MRLKFFILLVFLCQNLIGQSLEFKTKLLPNSNTRSLAIYKIDPETGESNPNDEVRKWFYNENGAIDSTVLTYSGTLKTSSRLVQENNDGERIEEVRAYRNGRLTEYTKKYFDGADFLFLEEIQKNINTEREFSKRVEYIKTENNKVKCRYSRNMLVKDSSVAISLDIYEYEFDTLLHKNTSYSTRVPYDSLALVSLSCNNVSDYKGKVILLKSNSIKNDTIISEAETFGMQATSYYFRLGNYIYKKTVGVPMPGMYISETEITSDSMITSKSIQSSSQGDILKTKIIQFSKETFDSYEYSTYDEVADTYYNKFKFNYSYEYDDRGNWVKRHSLSESGDKETLVREIIYY